MRGALSVLELEAKGDDTSSFVSRPATCLFAEPHQHSSLLSQVHETGQACDQELAYTTPGGATKRLLCDFYLMSDEDTGAQFVQVVYRDVTKQRSAEEALERHTQQRNMLLDMAHYLTASLDVQEVLTRIANGSRQILRADDCVIYILSDDRSSLEPIISLDPTHEEAVMACPLHVDSGLAGEALQNRGCIVVNDEEDAKGRVSRASDDERVIAAPFIVDEEVLGVMYLNRVGDPFDDDDVALARIFAVYAGTALKNAHTHDRLQHEVEERRKAEEALRQSEARNRAMLSAMPDTMLRLSSDGIVLDFKPAAVNIARIPQEEILGRSLEDVGFSGEVAANIRAAVGEVLKTGNRQTMDLDISVPPGVRHVEARIVPSGEREVVVIARDMTELRRTMIALDESRKRFSRFYYNAQVGLFRTRLVDGRFIVCNQRCAEIFGYKDRVQFMSEFYTSDHYVDATAREKLLAQLQETGDVRNFEARMTRRDGSIVWVRISARALPEESALEGVISDITDQMEADEKRRRLQEHIEQSQKLESLGKLAGGIAHHFNNLLQGIYGNADMALLELAEDSAARAYVEEIQSTSRKAADLSNQMLAYSGKGKFVVKEVDLDALVEETQNLLVVSAPRNITFRWDSHRALPRVHGDPSQLTQIIMNLVGNAWESMTDQGGVITVSTGTRECDRDFLANTYLGQDAPRGTYVFLAVRDTGCGMGEETLGKIFDPFFSTKGTGRGLGLAAVLGIVRGHHGTIQVQSRPRIGTSITVYFPSSVETETPQEAPGEAPVKTVLLVAQDKMVLTITARMLKTLGFEVLMTSDEQKAIELYTTNQERIAATFVDTDIQPRGGEDTIRTIRELDATAPIMVASGYADQSILSRLGDRRFSGFIQKPFQLDSLKEKTYRLLNPPEEAE